MIFKIFSQQNIEKYIGDQPYVLISIAGKHPDGSHGFAELLADPNRMDVLQLTFDDVSDNKDWEGNIDPDIIPFNESHARDIIDFTEYYEDNIDLICVNCYAGISRSSGVASALSVIRNGSRSDNWIWDSPKYYPNYLVYKTLLKVWQDNWTDDDEESLKAKLHEKGITV